MSKIRKKDPCPCGSGKKYKDCCFKKTKLDDDSLQEPREFPKEIDEILTKEDFVRKLAEVIRDLQTGNTEKYPALRWPRKRVAKMSNEDIYEKLESMNVHFDEEQFKKQAEQYTSAIELAEDLYYTQDWKGKDDEDFIWVSIIELWKRLLPGRVNLEMLDDAMLDGYDDMEHGDYESGLEEWETAWDIVKKIIPPTVMSVEEADGLIRLLPVFKLAQPLFQWCQHFEEDLYNGGLEDASWFTKRITYVTEFCERFPDTESSVLQQMQKAEAESYGLLGDIKKAENLFEVLTEKVPDNVQIYIAWGNIYWTAKYVGPPDYDKAEKIYRLGLARCSTGKDEISDRLTELKAKMATG